MSLVQSSLKFLSLCAVAASFAIPSLANSESTQDRIKPIGQTCMVGESCAAAVSSSPSGEPRSGEAVYSTKCFACHETGAAGAPKLGDIASWAGRLSARGLEGLYTSGIKGFNGMPPKGGCSDCSDDEIKGAIDHILSKSK